MNKNKVIQKEYNEMKNTKTINFVFLFSCFLVFLPA